MGRQLPRLACLLMAVGLALGTVAACTPWTIRPIDAGLIPTADGRARFDATTYVASVWATRVIPEVRITAAALDATAATAVESVQFVSGSGTVVQVDSRSRVGVALVDLDPGDGRPDVSIQIGPVLRGTALRDALPFIRFSDFANQLDFADVANALNRCVVESVLGGRAPALLVGRTVSFWGAAKPGGATPGRLPEIVPVILEGTPRLP